MDKILAYLKNYFYRFGEKGVYTIADNQIEVRGNYVAGQYIRITGSLLNDTVVKVESVEDNVLTLTEAINEVFDGVIYSLAIPRDLIGLVEEIKAYEKDTPKGGYISESFGNYSYSKATGENGGVADWKDVFKSELKPYRKIFDGIEGVKLI